MEKTKEIIKEMGKDIGTGLARAGKSTVRGIAQIVCKASYPVLGNLSWNLQNRIQNAFGEKYYSAGDATAFSALANIGGYSGLGLYFLGIRTKSALGIFGGLIGGAIIGVFEEIARKKIGDDIAAKYKFPLYSSMGVASLPGKLVSLPFDLATYAYDAGKRYFQDVRERINARQKSDLEQAASEPSGRER